MITHRVELGDRSYPVHVGIGLLERLHELIDAPRGDRVALFGDDRLLESDAVSKLTAGLQPLGRSIRRFGASGEKSKSIDNAAWLWSAMATNGFHRADLVVGFGGGVVTDLAGFVAATFHRGMPWVAVPTNLLGMVDASIGGKTGINLPEGKNLVGAFHQPLAVIADVSMLATVPDAVLRTGLAEVIKHGFIARADLLDRVTEQRDAIFARDPAFMELLVGDAAKVKVDVVSGDETEQGARAHLNYGHTVGHALETLGGYERFTHGEAVAIGMMFAAQLAAELGHKNLIALHRDTLESVGLPTGGAEHDFDEVAVLLARDKKYDAGIRFVILEDVGRPVVVRDVPEEAVRKAYEAIR